MYNGATNSSIGFLLNYWETMCNIREEEAPDRKGKGVRNKHSKVKSTKEKMNLRWVPPEDGQIKINVDGAFTNNGGASVGVVIRNSEGTILLSAWRVISCSRSRVDGLPGRSRFGGGMDPFAGHPGVGLTICNTTSKQARRTAISVDVSRKGDL